MARGLLGQSGLVLAAKVVAAGAAYVLAWALGRVAGVEAFGRFELVLTLFGMAAMLGRAGMDGAWIRHAPRWRAEGVDRRGVWWRAVGWIGGWSVLAGGALAVARGPLGEGLKSVGMAGDLGWAWLAVPGLAWAGFAAEGFRGEERFVGFAVLQRGTFLLGVAAAVLLGGDPVPVLAVGAMGAAVVALPVGARGMRGAAGGAAFRALRRTAGPMVLAAAAFELMSWSDTLMCGAFLDEAAVGRYRLAFRLAALLTLGQTAINSALAPRMARASVADLRSLVQWAFRWNALIALGGGAFLAATAPWLPGWFGADFTTPETVTALRILGLGTAFNALSGPVLTLMNTTGAERRARDIVLAAAALNIALNFYAIPRFGILGAATATTLTTVAWNVAAGLWVARRYGIWTWYPFNRRNR